MVNGPWKSDRLLTVKHMVSSERSPLFCGLISHASNSDRRDPCILMTSARSPESRMPGHCTAPLWTEAQEERGYRCFRVILHLLLDVIKLPKQSRYLLLEGLFSILCLPVLSFCQPFLDTTQKSHGGIEMYRHGNMHIYKCPRFCVPPLTFCVCVGSKRGQVSQHMLE